MKKVVLIIGIVLIFLVVGCAKKIDIDNNDNNNINTSDNDHNINNNDNTNTNNNTMNNNNENSNNNYNDNMDINKEKLNKVLNNKEKLIKENGKAVFLKDYIIAEGKIIDTIIAEPYEYAYVDFDADGKPEMVINISRYIGYNLVLHYNGKNVYGYEFDIRGLNQIKTDGSFVSSGGADSNYYCRLSFENNKVNIKYEAIKDSLSGIFELNGKKVSIQEINEYINKRKLKENINWIKLAQEETEVINIDLNKYLKVNYSGYSGAGTVEVSLDKERFYADNILKIKFKDTKKENEYYNLPNSKNSPIEAFFDYVNKITIKKNSHLKNNDIVMLEWNINKEQINKYFAINFSYYNEQITVKGLETPEDFNPMDYISMEYINGYIKLNVNINNISDKTLLDKIKNACSENNFTYDTNTISNKDHTIIVKYNIVDLNDENSISSFIRKYGLKPTENQRIYKINNYRYKINNISEINNTFWKNATEDCKNKLSTYSEQITVNNLKNYESYYSYLDNDLVIVFKVEANAKYIDRNNLQNPITKDVTYYYLSTYRDLIYDQNNILTFSSRNYHQNGEMFRKEIEQNQNIYTFAIDGVETPEDAKNLIYGNLLSSDARGIEYYKFN